MTGLLGFTSGYHAMMNCTTLLMIGTDFPYQQFFPRDATIVQIDLRGEQLGRRTKLDYGFVGDTKATLQALLPKLKQNGGDKHLKQSVELEMKAAGFVDFGTDLQNPDFAKLAEAAGVLGLTAETPQDVRPMITQALKHDGPALVEVLVHRQELSVPPTISLAQMKGFTLFTLKAVLSGRGDEVVDLAKINLFR
jgi:thiamine pyrophosphate-dependent acetolactate synthase large subunit-like protein